MKVKVDSTEQKLNKNNYPNNISFKGAGVATSSALHFLNAYPAVGALCIDICSMGIPRTCIDSFRGPDAAKETAIREFSSTLNFALIGLWSTLAACGLGHFFNKRFNGAQIQKTFANNTTIDVLSEMYNKHAGADKTENIKKFTEDFTNSIETLNSSEWRKIKTPEVKKEVQKLLAEALNTSKFDKEADKLTQQKIISLVTAETGANQSARITFNKKTLDLSLSNMVENFISLGRNFTRVSEGKLNNEFIKAVRNNKMAASLLGLSIPFIIGTSTQPINRYLTKLRTGKEGFVGIQGEKADNSGSFGLWKLLLAPAAAIGAISTIGKNPISKLQFTGLIPGVAQLKLLYGFTIASRILSARDKNELRETCLKDTFGFVNWLILGGFVSKLVANKLDKNIMNYDQSGLDKNASSFKKAWHWITNAQIKSTEEILIKDMHDAGMKITDANGNPKSFKTLLKELPENMIKTRKKISAANKAQAAGYIYSMLAIGIGIPILNIFMTKYYTKKKPQKNSANPAEDKKAQTVNLGINQYFIKPEMVAQIKNANSSTPLK